MGMLTPDHLSLSIYGIATLETTEERKVALGKCLQLVTILRDQRASCEEEEVGGPGGPSGATDKERPRKRLHRTPTFFDNKEQNY